jgi:hypothetical protein
MDDKNENINFTLSLRVRREKILGRCLCICGGGLRVAFGNETKT